MESIVLGYNDDIAVICIFSDILQFLETEINYITESLYVVPKPNIFVKLCSSFAGEIIKK